ncbi:hypothetical protein AVT67_gp14 [Klebsiella phage vB_KpnP_SU552A]|uniref:Uncharacterized protein n=1 Tax=Klebsiella phage vB_KpnP_SU552A TaxID=1610835 RepID=A0A0C5PIH9_9CAUD|nr:hypothetical protein AVT67_gp14 [Klebsiella phage vB_KpnP_SU552A]AJQ21129.1 hypothetical protein SU552A_14 [Klebsiella phage vB_KpnP_SU552A]
MTVQVISKVCDCGKGYRSAHDLKCGHCRSKQEGAQAGPVPPSARRCKASAAVRILSPLRPRR